MPSELEFVEIIKSQVISSVNGEIVYQKRLDDKINLLKHFAKTKLGVNLKTKEKTTNAEFVIGNFKNGDDWVKVQDKIVVYIEKNDEDISEKIDYLKSLCNVLGINYFIWAEGTISGSTVTLTSDTTNENFIEVFSIPVKKYLKKNSVNRVLKIGTTIDSNSNKNISWFDKLMQVFN